jgi:hypothetical protein
MKALGFAGAVAVTTAFLAVPQPAQAGTRLDIGIFLGLGHDHRREAYRTGYERGYREGVENGQRDAHHRRRFDYVHDKAYRCADAGYHGHCGPKPAYQSGFRNGYEAGYREAYARVCRERDRYHGRGHGHPDHDHWSDRRYDDRDRDWDER